MDIGKEKEKIERERKRLQEKEKFLKEKERRKRIERAKEVGKIAAKTEIDAMEKDLLLGAFLEIGERIGDENSVSSWRKKAEDFLGSLERAEESALLISFEEEIEEEAREILKRWKFRWNKFRKEFYGYGCKNSLEQELGRFAGCRVEVVE